MKAFLLILSFISFSFLCKAQIHSSVDLVGSYDFINSLDNGAGIYIEERNKSGYRFGANFNVRIFEKTILKTGFRFARHRHTSRMGNNQFSNYDSTIDELYIEIPFVFRYEFSHNAVTPYLELGFAPHFFRKGVFVDNNNGVVTKEDIEIEYLDGRRMRFASSFAFGLQFKLSKSNQLFVQPTVRLFRPIEFNMFSRLTALNFGVEIGVRQAISFVNAEDFW